MLVRSKYVLPALALALAVAFASLEPAAAGPRWGADYFPNVPLITQDGKVVHFYDDLLKGKVVAIDMIYTHCVDSCPLETARLAQAQKLLGDRVGKEIFFYSITLDPKRDTPEALKAYAEKYHVGPGWLFLTGKPADIDLLSKKLGLYSDPDAGNRDGHMPILLLGDEATGQWMKNSAVENPKFLSMLIEHFMGEYNDGPSAAPGYAQASEIHVNSGEYLFATRCSACHTVGHGDKIGPDLIGISRQRDHEWLSRFIAMPDKMLEENDPIAVALFAKYKEVQMPNLRLNPAQTAAILDYIQHKSEANNRTTLSGAIAAPAPDPNR